MGGHAWAGDRVKGRGGGAQARNMPSASAAEKALLAKQLWEGQPESVFT